MVFRSWLRRRPAEPNPAWLSAAQGALRRWRHLNESDVDRLLVRAAELDRSWRWEGLSGLTITPAMRGRVSALAGLLTLNVDHRPLQDVTSILIAPNSVVQKTRQQFGESMVRTSHVGVLGESLLHGPVRLAWDQIKADSLVGSINSVVLHEFAHKVDMSDGVANGTPVISGRERAIQFEQACDKAAAKLVQGENTWPLRPYAATNRAELFAVASEAFFLQPQDLGFAYPELQRVFIDFYRQEPLLRS